MLKSKLFTIAVILVAGLAYACDDSSSNDSQSSQNGTTTDPSDQNTTGGDSNNNNQNPNNNNQNQNNNTPTEDADTTDQDKCNGEEVDLMTDPNNCGSCNKRCGAYETCYYGTCTCNDNYFDCDNDGVCETQGSCACEPGQTIECYTGPSGTQGVGTCKSGTAKCVATLGSGVYWDTQHCDGQVIPRYNYTCDPTQPDLDIDCDGIPDAHQDHDNDGYPLCNEAGDEIYDCCDSSAMCATSYPELINPGRVDCFGNNLDDNCSGTVDDNPDVSCSTSSETVVEADCKIKERSCSSAATWTFNSKSNISASGALALAQAFDACLDVVTEESHKPGLIEFSITPASDYNIGIDPRQFNIKDGMYDAAGNKLITPRVGETFVILSSGIAGDAHTELAQYGTDDVKMSLGGSIPEPYRSAHKNNLQTHPACASGGADIYDTVRLHLKMRAPDNAQGISFDFRFFSREYPFYVCSKYNDFFLALLTDENGNAISEDPDKADGNISFDNDGNPISVNNAFFKTCAPAPCSGNFQTPISDKCPAMLSCDSATNLCGGDMCTLGTTELPAYYPQYYSGSSDDPKDKRGGGTAWLTTKAPVKPGEVFNLDFYIWDTGDLRFDSSVILDNFQWSCEKTTISTDYATSIVF